jgi:enoyl-CoA hydratase/carnithine racemase
MNDEVLGDLEDALGRRESDGETRVVIVAGHGEKALAAGG